MRRKDSRGVVDAGVGVVGYLVPLDRRVVHLVDDYYQVLHTKGLRKQRMLPCLAIVIGTNQTEGKTN